MAAKWDMVVVAPNGAVDSYYILPCLNDGAINRAEAVLHTAGGKGHNLARAATLLGARPLSVGIAGGETGRLIQADLQREGIAHDLVWANGPSRVTVSLVATVPPSTTVVLDPGQEVGEEARAELSRRVLAHAAHTRFVVLTGSQPVGFPDHFYADLIQDLKKDGVTTYVDTSGAGLRLAVEAGVSSVKVNRDEFEGALSGGQLSNAAVLKRTFERFVRDGLRSLIVTDGPNGAVVVGDQAEPFRVRTRPRQIVNPVGAGDTFLAGLVVAQVRQQPLVEAARYASAAAAANVEYVQCGYAKQADVDELLERTEVVDLSTEVGMHVW